MWRGYSPKKDAVKIKTTIRTLYDSLCAQVGRYRDVSCFIGRVRYFPTKHIAVELSRVNLFDLTGVAIAATLLVKRWAFRSEKEVRLIYYDHQRSFSAEVFRYELDPSSVFAKAILDPRMTAVEFEKWKRRFQKAGFSNRITQSELYKLPEPLVLKIG